MGVGPIGLGSAWCWSTEGKVYASVQHHGNN
jgi:hypothetical protein